MRILLLVTGALFSFASGSHAQVAAPRINPLAAAATRAFNFAVIPWSAQSRIGGGVFTSGEITLQTSAGGNEIKVAEGDQGFGAQVRLVGENFAAMAEAQSFRFDLTSSSGRIENSTQAAGIAFQGGEFFSAGVGMQQAEERNDFSSIDMAKHALPTVGGTLRLGGVLFLGAAAGMETVEQETVLVSSSLERSVVRFGVGLFSGDSDFAWHLEAYGETKESAQDPNGFLDVNSEETTGLTVELRIFGGLLVSLEGHNTKKRNPAGGVGTEDETRSVSVGWAPSKGLALIASISESEADIPGFAVFHLSGSFIGAAFLF